MNNKINPLKRLALYSMSSSLVYVVLVFVALGLIANCKSREVGLPAPAAQVLSGGKLVFEDDFKSNELGVSWHRGTGESGKGKWIVANGGVEGSALRNDPLWLTIPLPGSVRVEFEAQAKSEVGDLKVEVFGDGENHASGYVLIFGGWNNRLDVIARLDEHGEDRKERTTGGVELDRVYKMAIVRSSSGVLRWYVDGVEFMTYQDAAPLKGTEQQYFAFSNWDAPVRFSKVRVYELDAH